MRLDTHQHFWSLGNPFTDWPTPDLTEIHRDFGSDDLVPILQDWGIDGTILVQAAPSLEETRYCLELAARLPFVKGVVGWLDFEAGDALEQLESIASDPLLKGLRPMVQSIAEPGWLLKDSLEPVFRDLGRRGLCFDALVLSHQLADLSQFADRYSELAIVLDHAGKPPIASGANEAWQQNIAQLARNPSVYCKLSGLWTEACGDHSIGNIQPYVDHLLATFGPERLMWGSDWPVVNLAGNYGDWLTQCEAMLAALDQDQKAAVFGGNGARFYGID
jgi:L-fuconolactonase